MTAANCVIGSKPHGADVGYLCRGHFEKLGAMLRDIEDETVQLSAVPSMQQSSGSRGGTLASHRAPARLDAVVLRDQRRGTGTPLVGEADPWGFDDTPSILDALHSWARVVREERALSTPASVTVTGERDVLTRGLPWIAEQPWVDEIYGEMSALNSALKRINGTQADKPVGRCVHPYGDAECGGTIRRAATVSRPWATLTDRCVQIDVDTAEGHAYCQRCGCTWDGAEVHRLTLMLEQRAAEARRPRTVDGRPMRTAEELASDLGLRLTAVRMRLSRAAVKAAHGGYYDPAVLGAPQQSAEAS